jgi:voltage-gated potassium channel Kch
MILTPLISVVNEKWLKIGHARSSGRPFDEIENHESRVIIAGLGRFGQMIGRILILKKISITVLDSSFEQVETAGKFGYKAYFGDASRLDLLRAARADQAEVFVLAIDDVEASVKTAEMVRKHFPHLKIYARARDRVHAYRLMDVGVDKLIRETLLSSLDLARDVLIGLGQSTAKADAAVRMFQKHDEELLVTQHRIHKDEAKIIASSKQGMDELQRLFEQDAGQAKSV